MNMESETTVTHVAERDSRNNITQTGKRKTKPYHLLPAVRDSPRGKQKLTHALTKQGNCKGEAMNLAEHMI